MSGIHSTAIVDKGASIGKETSIWHFSHVCSGAVIGSNVSIGQNVFVGNKVQIGKRCKIQNNVSIYDNVILEDDVFCGPSMVFTNVINPRASISRKDQYLTTIVRKGATIGANATIICGVTIGDYAFIAAGAVLTKDAKPFSMMMGVPAIQVGWYSKYGERIPLPLKGHGKFECSQDKSIYCLNNDSLSVMPFASNGGSSDFE